MHTQTQLFCACCALPGLHACLHGKHDTVSAEPEPLHEPDRYLPKPQSDVHCGSQSLSQYVVCSGACIIRRGIPTHVFADKV